jgi:tetratricopeptide (TPR) repeat protein
MRRQRLIINILSVVFVVQFIFMFASCASSGVSKENKAEYKEMKRFQRKKEYLAALSLATKLTSLEPEARGPKKFIHEHFDENMQIAMRVLASKPQTSAQAEKQYRMYTSLVEIYDNLANVKLPIMQKKGKWSWTTEMKDYKGQKETARKLAYDMLTKDAHQFVATQKYKEAKAYFKNAIENYLLTNEEKIAARKEAVNAIMKKANQLSKSNNVDEAVNAYHFYKTALSFNHENQAAIQGAAKMKKRIAVLYIAEGAKLERTRDVKNWETAVTKYKRAFHWDNTNETAKTKEKKCVLRITGYYYNLGLRAEKGRKASVAVENYRLAMSWTPNYKDCMYRMYNVRISCQLDSCTKYSRLAKRNCAPMFAQARKIKTSVDKSYNTIHGIEDIVGSVSNLNENLEQLSGAIQPLGYIPVVGPAVKTVKYSIDRTHTKVDAFSKKLTIMDKPVLIPMESLLASAKKQLAQNDVYNQQYQTGLKQIPGLRSKIKTMLKNFGNNESEYKKVEAYVKDIAVSLRNMGNVSVKATKNLVTLYKVSNVIDNYERYIVPAAKAINKVQSVLNKMKPTLKSINDALNKKIGYKWVSASARQVLNGIDKAVPGFIKSGLKKLAKKAVAPALKKMGVKIPDIPYVAQATQLLDRAKGYYEQVKSSVTNWTKCNKDYEKNCRKLTTSINRLNSIEI